MKLIILALFTLISFVAPADKDLFKNCANSSFCRRCRKVSGTSKYEVLGNTLNQATSTGITVDIRNNENGILFVMKLGVLKV